MQYQNQNGPEFTLNILKIGAFSLYDERGVSVEQRRFKRFDIRLPVRLLRNGFRPLSAAGETKNMSSGGVLFTSEAKIDVGEAIEYIITLTADRESAQPVTLHCLGKVVRMEDAEPLPEEPVQAFHIAATLERYEFVRPRA